MRSIACLVLVLMASATIAGQVIYRGRIATASATSAPSDGNPTLDIFSCPTNVSVSPTVITGTASDNVSVTVSGSNDKGGACTTTNTGTTFVTWSSSCILTADDTNTITFTASDGSPPHATGTCAVTYTTPDPTDPTVTVTTPSGDSAGTLSGQTFTGRASDNVAVTSVRVRNNGGAWLTASGTTSWSRNVTYVIGANVVEAQSLDEQGNDSPLVTRTYTRSVDASAPVCTITEVNDVAYTVPVSTATNSIKIEGTCTDAGGVVRARVFPIGAEAYATQAPSALSVYNGVANPNVAWAISNRRLKLGQTDYCVRAWDGDGLVSPDVCATITFTRPTVIVTSELGAPPARTGTAWSYDLYADGSDGVFTWDRGDSGVYTFADADCAGLSGSEVTVGVYEVWRISGTPSGSGTCTLTARATGGDATSDTWTAPLTIGAGALEGPYEYFTTVSAISAALPVNGGNSNGLRTASDRATVFNNLDTWGTSDTTWAIGIQGADDIKLSQGYLRSTNGSMTTGKALMTWTTMFDWSERSYSCRGGQINYLQGSWGKKEYNWFTDQTASTTKDNRIYFETNVLHGGVLDTPTDCLLVGTLGQRWYASRIVGDLPLPSQPQMPVCGTPPNVGEGVYQLSGLVIYRLWYQVEIGMTETDFTEWEACTGLTLPVGTYYRVNAWIWGEFDATPTRTIYNVPASRVNKIGDTQIWDALRDFNLEYDTSDNPGILLGDVTTRVRDLVMFRNYNLPATPEDDTTIFKRPRR